MADNRGGKRAGAGHPTKSKKKAQAYKSLPEPSMDLSLLAAITNMPEKMMRAAAEMARGRSQNSVSELLGIDPTTITRWRKEPVFALMVEKEITKLCTSPTDVFGPMMPDMVATYEHHLRKKSLEAAKDVRDSIFGKPVTRVQTEGKLDIIIEFRKQSEEYIDAEIVNGSIE